MFVGCKLIHLQKNPSDTAPYFQTSAPVTNWQKLPKPRYSKPDLQIYIVVPQNGIHYTSINPATSTTSP
jgi:hypothetical protein